MGRHKYLDENDILFENDDDLIIYLKPENNYYDSKVKFYHDLRTYQFLPRTIKSEEVIEITEVVGEYMVHDDSDRNYLIKDNHKNNKYIIYYDKKNSHVDSINDNFNDEVMNHNFFRHMKSKELLYKNEKSPVICKIKEKVRNIYFNIDPETFRFLNLRRTFKYHYEFFRWVFTNEEYHFICEKNNITPHKWTKYFDINDEKGSIYDSFCGYNDIVDYLNYSNVIYITEYLSNYLSRRVDLDDLDVFRNRETLPRIILSLEHSDDSTKRFFEKVGYPLELLEYEPHEPHEPHEPS